MDSSPKSAMSLDLEGELHSYTLPSLLFSVCQSRETGVLTVEQLTVAMKQTCKTIYIQDGEAIFATSNDREDRLGQLFLRRGTLSMEHLVTGIDRSLSERKRLGTILVEEGWIRPVDLVSGITEQVKEIILSLFQWTDGCYKFVMGDLPTKEIVTLQMSIRNLVLEGINRIQSWYRIQEALGGLETCYQTSPNLSELTQDMNLSLEQWSLLSVCDEPLSLKQICASSALKDFEICRLMWAFLATGMVRKIG